MTRLPGHTVCPRSSESFNIVTYYIKLVTTSWTYSTYNKYSIQNIQEGFFSQFSCHSIFSSLANEYCYKKAEFGMQISLIWKHMFLITYKPLVLLLTRHLCRLKVTGKKLYGGLQCTMRMTRGKNEEKNRNISPLFLFLPV